MRLRWHGRRRSASQDDVHAAGLEGRARQVWTRRLGLRRGIVPYLWCVIQYVQSTGARVDSGASGQRCVSEWRVYRPQCLSECGSVSLTECVSFWRVGSMDLSPPGPVGVGLVRGQLSG